MNRVRRGNFEKGKPCVSVSTYPAYVIKSGAIRFAIAPYGAKNEADCVDAISRLYRRWSVTADNRVLSEEQALISAMLDAIEGNVTKGL